MEDELRRNADLEITHVGYGDPDAGPVRCSRVYNMTLGMLFLPPYGIATLARVKDGRVWLRGRGWDTNGKRTEKGPAKADT